MDDSDVRGGNWGRLGHSLDSSLSKAPQEPSRLSRLLNSPTLLFRRPFHRLPAPWFPSLLFSVWLPRKFRISMDLVFNFFSFTSADLYWKNEHRLMCTSDTCTAAERDRYEKSVSFHDISRIFVFVLVHMSYYSAKYWKFLAKSTWIINCTICFNEQGIEIDQ